MTTTIESKLKVLIAVNEANRVMYDYMDSQQKEIERLNKEVSRLREILDKPTIADKVKDKFDKL